MFESSEPPLPLEQEQQFLLVRRAADVLLAIGVLLVLASVVHGYLRATVDLNQYYSGGTEVDLPAKVKIMTFLESSILNSAWSALVIAASFALRLGVARGLNPAPFVDYEPTTAPGAVIVTSPIPRTESRTPSIPIRDDDEMWRPKT